MLWKHYKFLVWWLNNTICGLWIDGKKCNHFGRLTEVLTRLDSHDIAESVPHAWNTFRGDPFAFKLVLCGSFAHRFFPGVREGSSNPATPQSQLESRSEEHTSELQSQSNLVCRLL